MTTALTKATGKASPLTALATRFNIEPTKLLEVMRGTIIKPDRSGKKATDEEVAAFCIVADQYGLNPFTREIHAFASGDKGVVPIVGIDGWAKLVNARDDFDGCTFDEVADDKGLPVSVTCHMHVKGRGHPVSITERYSECRRNTPPWTGMPWRMLRHKSFMQAARIAFGLAGIYDEDEARDIQRGTVQAEVVDVTAAKDRLLSRPAPFFLPDVQDDRPEAHDAQIADDAMTSSDDQPEADQPERPEQPIVVGRVEAVTEKKGLKDGKPWTRYGIKIDGTFYNTFSDTIAGVAKDAKASGDDVELEFRTNDRGFHDAVSIKRLVDEVPQ